MISDKTYQLIGKLSLEFNKLEFLLSEFLDAIVTPAIPSYSYLEKYSFNQKLEMIKADLNARNLDPENKADLADLIHRIDKCRLERNELVHAQILNDPDGIKEIALLGTLRNTIQKEINHDEMEELVKRISLLRREIFLKIFNLINKFDKTGK
jgi:hypothetical protein